MNFLISDTFIESLAKLTGDEQKAAKTTAFDLHMNSANPGMSFHKLDKARDKNFWSVRVSSDIRLIVHKTTASLLLCYVDHHDKAYGWAERRKLETHPQTGAAQLVEMRETVQEIVIPKYVEVKQASLPKPPLFAHVTKDILLSYGVPEEWLPDVQLADEDSLLDLAVHLPTEAADALLVLATGGKPQVAPPLIKGADPFSHPDAQQSFSKLNNFEEFERILKRDIVIKLKDIAGLGIAIKGPEGLTEDEWEIFFESVSEAGKKSRKLLLREIRQGMREANFNELRQLEIDIEKIEQELVRMKSLP